MSQSDLERSRPAANPSRVNEHLANERTFLAWVRTSLGLIGLGFVIARMGLFLRQIALLESKGAARGLHGSREFMVTGVVFLLIGAVLCGWSGRLYHRARRAIDDNRYEPDESTVLVVTGTIVTGGLILVGLVLWSTN